MVDNVRGRYIRNHHRSRYTAKPPSPVIFPPQFTVNSTTDPCLDINLTATRPLPPNPSIIDAPNSDSDLGYCTATSPLPPNPSVIDALDSDSDWGYYTDERLEDRILHNLDLVYNEALTRLICIDYDESTARHAILCNGYCYGSNDVLSNIPNNVIYFLNSPPTYEDLPTSYAFATLRQLEEYCLTIMLTILQQVRPHLTRGDAMWCLLMSDLHVGHASTLQIPGSCVTKDADNGNKLVTSCSRHRRPEPMNSDIVGSLLKSLEIMSIEETPNVTGTEEQEKEMILDLGKTKEFVMLVRFMEVWAQQKALQTSRKVSIDLDEFNTLRAKREENQHEKKRKPRIDDSTIKRLTDMEVTLKRASVEIDRVNSVVRKLDTENAEVWVEMEASKLSSSKSAKIWQEMEKHENCHKRLQAWEKQIDKLKEDITEGRKITEVDPKLNGVLGSNKQVDYTENADELAACCPRYWWHSASCPELLNSDIVNSMLKSLESMGIEGASNVARTEEQKKEMILDLVRKVWELDVQVSERKEWAQQKALQAAQKVSSHLAELNNLRAEREENQLEKKGKSGLDDSMMKQLSEMEAALKRASEEVDRPNSVVRKLETENAELQAEIEAFKLCASESTKMWQEVEKREKKCLKRLQACEKQRDKLKEDIAEERRKIAEAEQELTGVLDSNKQAEMKLRQTIKAKELAIAQVEEERRAREATDVSIKRRHELLQQKIELDFQRHKDHVQRLEEELSRLKASDTLSSVEVNAPKTQKESNLKMVKGFNKPKPSPPKKNRRRECVICMQDEVSVVLLPCAHQVLCARCNEEHEKKAKGSCPCCNVLIEERIRVYGANS